VKLLSDEMYAPALAGAMRDAGIEAAPVAELALAGRSDADLFAEAIAGGHVILTENVADVARLAADRLSSGKHHPGVLSRCLRGSPDGPLDALAW
jgi:predicted nuclease of predicted toxin-antitoxin system